MKDKKMEQDIALGTAISPAYEKFFNRFKEIEILNIEQWKVLHLIGYFCKRYETYYNMRYSFKFSNPAPSKSYEVFQIKKISNMLSSDPKILKDYIDWVFDKKIIERKKRLTSMGFLSTTDIVNEYKFKFLFNKTNVIDRTTLLSPRFLDIAKEIDSNIKTYGDLAFIKQSINLSLDGYQNYKHIFDKLSVSGLNLSILDKIK